MDVLRNFAQTEIDFDVAVQTVRQIFGNSPLHVFFTYSYLMGFPEQYQHRIDFMRDPGSVMEMDRMGRFQSLVGVKEEPGCETVFWTRFRACFGGRDQYCAICSAIFTWLATQTDNNPHKSAWNLLNAASRVDAEMFLGKHDGSSNESAYWKKTQSMDLMHHFYTGEFFGETAVRNDPNLRTRIHAKLRAPSQNEMFLTVACRLINQFKPRRDAVIPQFIRAFQHDDSGKLNYLAEEAKIDGYVFGGKTLVRDFFKEQTTQRVYYAELVNEGDTGEGEAGRFRYNELLFFHTLLFYNNINGVFSRVVSSIRDGLEPQKYHIMPYAGTHTLKWFQFDQMTSETKMSERSYSNLKDLWARVAQDWPRIDPREMAKTIANPLRKTSWFQGWTMPQTRGSGIS